MVLPRDSSALVPASEDGASGACGGVLCHRLPTNRTWQYEMEDVQWHMLLNAAFCTRKGVAGVNGIHLNLLAAYGNGTSLQCQIARKNVAAEAANT